MNRKIEINPTLMILNNDHDARKIYSFFALSVTIPVLVAIGYALSFMPDKLDTAYISRIYNLPLVDFVPENAETCQYLVLSVLFPILFSILYQLFSTVQIRHSMREIVNIAVLTELGIIVLLSGWSLLENYYGVEGFSHEANIVFTIVIAFLIILWTAFMSGVSIVHEISGRFQRILGIPAILVMAGAVLFVSWIYITPDYFFSSYTLHHFDAYFYPVFEIYNGKTLLVDFNSLYGFYPYLMTLGFKLFGGISMYRFSIMIAFLVMVNAAAIGASIWLNIKNKIVAVIGFLTILCTMFLSSIFTYNGYYLQYVPHRTLFPSLIILVASILIRTRKPVCRGILTATGYFVGTVSLFWNIDTGVVVVAGWFLFQSYLVASKYSLREKTFYIKIVKITIWTILSVLLTIVSVSLVTYTRTGRYVGLDCMFASQILFKGTGFYMLPMKLQHPWIILAIVYAAGLVKSLRLLPLLLHKKENLVANRKHPVYFLLSVLGVGLFSYFQGRSHPDVFVAVIWPGILLMIGFADEYASKVLRQGRKKFENLPYHGVRMYTDLGKLILSMGLLVTLTVSYITLDYRDKTGILHFKESPELSPQTNLIRNNIDFIKKNRIGEEEIDLIMLYLTECYCEMGMKNPMPVRSLVDWFTKEDYSLVIDYLKKTDHKVFLDKRAYDLLMQYVPDEYTGVMKKRFKLVDTFQNMKCYVPIEN